jgi:hypothetical protein
MTVTRYIENHAGVDALLSHIVATDCKDVADGVVTRAKSFCPVRTGRLQHSIHAVREFNDWYIGSEVYYAWYVENGTSRMAARHFLRRGLYAGGVA